ncbi:unnamed protein product, partial [Scytosiphon promiscuus]
GGGRGRGKAGKNGRSEEDDMSDPSLRTWLCLCFAKLCWRYTDAQDACVRLRVQDSLFACLQGKGETVEVRCSAVYALGSLYSRATTATPAAAAAAAAAAQVGANAAAAAAAAAGAGFSQGPTPQGQQQQQQQQQQQYPPHYYRQHAKGSPASPRHTQGFGGAAPGAGLMPMAPMGPMGPQGGEGAMEPWPSLEPDCSAGGAVAGTSETRRLDELDIASRLAKHSRDASPLLRREVVLALGVLVVNPAHFPFFVTVAQELALEAEAAAAAAREDGTDRRRDGKSWSSSSRTGGGIGGSRGASGGIDVSSPLESNGHGSGGGTGGTG